MSSTGESRKTMGRIAVVRGLAPHVDEKWAESFMVELRLIGIEGAGIGAALSEVESHCSESGQGAGQAFGDPVDYARSLQLRADGNHSPRAVLRSLAPIMVQVVGMFILNWGFDDWLRRQQFELATGHVVIAAGFLLGVFLLARFTDSVLRVAVYHPVRSGIMVWFAYIASTATCVAALILLDEVVWRASAGWGPAAGARVLLAGVGWGSRRRDAAGRSPAGHRGRDHRGGGGIRPLQRLPRVGHAAGRRTAELTGRATVPPGDGGPP